MRTTRVVAVLVVTMLAVWMVGAAEASAMKRVVLQTASGTLEPGAELTLSSSNFVFESSGGRRIQCEQATLTGTLTSNSAPSVNASFTEGEFTSEPHNGCLDPLALGFPNEYVPISAARLPWTATFKSNRTATLAGAEGVGFAIEAVAPTCTWYGKRIVGDLDAPYGFLETPGPKQMMRVQKGAPCYTKGPVNQSKATIAAEWTLTSAGETVTAHIQR
jgi:hypothetical protein